MGGMEILLECIQDQRTLFAMINILEFAMGLLLCLIPLKKAWQEYFACAYGGFLFGAFPAYYISESMLFMLVCSVILAAGFCLAQHLYRDSLYLPMLVVLAKGFLVAGSIVLYEMDSDGAFIGTDTLWSMEQFFGEDTVWTIEQYFWVAAFLSVVAYVALNFVVDLAAIQSHVPLALFGAMELCGASIQLYRINSDSLDKLMHDREGTIDLLFYMLKVDFSYFDEHVMFIGGLVVIMAAHFLWNKLFRAVRAFYARRKTECGTKG